MRDRNATTEKIKMPDAADWCELVDRLGRENHDLRARVAVLESTLVQMQEQP